MPGGPVGKKSVFPYRIRVMNRRFLLQRAMYAFLIFTGIFIKVVSEGTEVREKGKTQRTENLQCGIQKGGPERKCADRGEMERGASLPARRKTI